MPMKRVPGQGARQLVPRLGAHFLQALGQGAELVPEQGVDGLLGLGQGENLPQVGVQCSRGIGGGRRPVDGVVVEVELGNGDERPGYGQQAQGASPD
ncbi:hypothetical protein GCM10010193_65020 [Kitasatospora atroaurantiaca]